MNYNVKFENNFENMYTPNIIPTNTVVLCNSVFYHSTNKMNNSCMAVPHVKY